MEANEVINNLNLMSKELNRIANKPSNFNTEWGYYLDKMSRCLYKQANEIGELVYLVDASASVSKEDLS